MSTTWIYHERQEAMLCGQHALNNLLQTQAFSPGILSDIAHQLDEIELRFMANGNRNDVVSKDYIERVQEGSGHVDPSGNFSIEVLRSALLTNFNLTLVNTLQENIRDKEITFFDGFICNRSSHWFAVRKINGLFWNLNSTLEKPEQISHFKFAAEMQALRNDGYSVFCITEVGALPSPCTNENELLARGEAQFWWKEEDLLRGKGSKGYSNAWNNVGNGIRLDGKSTSVDDSSKKKSNSTDMITLEGLSEEDMIQMALEASIEQAFAGTKDHILATAVVLAPEPDPKQNGAIRIQFRFPNGNKISRRFLETEEVQALAAFAQEQCPGKSIEILAGFPLKSLSSLYNNTIKDAKLSGEQIHCRYL